MKLSYHTLSLALALALPGVAAAQNAPTELDDVTVTATRTPISIENSVVPVQVIDRAQIDHSQANSLQDLLRGRAGLDFANQGGNGKITSLFLRGHLAVPAWQQLQPGAGAGGRRARGLGHQRHGRPAGPAG